MSGSLDGPALSVVVPTVGRATRLFLTLSALCRQVTSDRFEIVLVDDNPTAPSAAEVVRMLDRPDLVRTVVTGGVGVASARNAGAQAADGRILLFVDDDTVADSTVVDQHLRSHRGTATAVVHGTVVDLTAFTATPDGGPGSRSLAGPRGRRLDVADLDQLPFATRRLGRRRSFIERAARTVADDHRYQSLRWLLCIGTNTSMSRSLFDSVRGFDRRYDHWGGEDLELGLRLMAAGAQFSRIDAVAYHLPLARGDVADTLTDFWHTVAGRHQHPPLARVGEFLRGDLTLDALADSLVG
jgi:glycosyltransferase involved in cell wall biosynthesis